MTRAVRAAVLLAGAAVLVWLIAAVGPRTIASLLARVGWGFLFVSIAYTIHVATRALALWRCLPPSLLPYADVLRVRLAGEAVEMLTFTGPFLAEPAKGWLLKREGLSGPDAFGGVALEYLLYTVVSAVIAIAALSMLVARGALGGGLRTAVIWVVVGMIVFTAGFFAAAITGVGLLVPLVRAGGSVIGRRRADAAIERIRPVEEVLVGFMRRQPGRLAEVLAIEAGAHALLAAEIWIVVNALGYRFPPSSAFVVEGAVKFISIAFFFVPGQVGASEGVYTLLFRTLGYTGAIGLTVALVRRVRALIVAGIGVLALTVSGWRASA